MKITNSIELPIGENKLVAFVNDWDDGTPKEIFVSLVDKNGNCFQDICMVRQSYKYNTQKRQFDVSDNKVDCKVWNNSDDEDYTDKFEIDIKDEED